MCKYSISKNLHAQLNEGSVDERWREGLLSATRLPWARHGQRHGICVGPEEGDERTNVSYPDPCSSKAQIMHGARWLSMCLDWRRVGSNPDFRVGLNPVGVWLEGWVEPSFLFGLRDL